jgi:hypothetical protein
MYNEDLMNRLLFFFSFLLIPSAIMAQNRGYMNITSFGVLAGTSADEKPAPLSIITEHHYRFNNYISLGAMTGIEQLNENMLPAAVNLKLFLPAGACEFFFAGLGGYAVSLEKPKTTGIQKATGGFMAGAETGLFIRVNSGSSIVVALGYRYSELNYKLQDWWIGNYERKITFNRFAVRIGIAIY